MNSRQTGSPSVLQATNISAGHSGKSILHGVSLTLKAGEFVGLAGPNGSGKSTLLQTLTGYLPAHGGSIALDGASIGSFSRAEIARQLAFVPQRTEVAFVFTALEMVLMGRHAYAGYGARDDRRDVDLALAMLAKLSVEALADRPFPELSGGEQQLVLMARALAQGSPLILLDEPLTGLDLQYQGILMGALERIRKEEGRGILASFHDIAAATRWCSRLILLHGGQIYADGPPEQVITSESLAACYGVTASVSRVPGQQGLSVYVEGPQI